VGRGGKEERWRGGRLITSSKLSEVPVRILNKPLLGTKVSNFITSLETP